MRRGDHFAPESGDGISRLRLLPSWSVAEERPGCRSLAEAAARVEAAAPTARVELERPVETQHRKTAVPPVKMERPPVISRPRGLLRDTARLWQAVSDATLGVARLGYCSASPAGTSGEIVLDSVGQVVDNTGTVY